MEGLVTIEADRIEWQAGNAVASGQLRISWEDQVLVGERATVTAGVIRVEAGTWTRGDTVLSFSSAEVTLSDETASLADLHVVLGGATIDAEALRVLPDGTWVLDSGRLAPCACEDGRAPAITFRAREVEVVPDRVVVLRGGTIRLFGVPVAPVPWARISLRRDRFHLLLPEVGYGDPGLSVRWEGAGTVDGWSLRGGPAFLQERGVRVVAAVAGPWAKGSAEAGWDWAEERVRASVATQGGVDEAARGAWDVSLTTDRTYADDYAVDYLARGVAWREARGVAEWGPFRGTAWFPDDGTRGELGQVRARWEWERGAFRVAPRAVAGVVGAVGAIPGTEDVVEGEPASLLGVVGVEAGGSGTVRGIHAEARGDAAFAVESSGELPPGVHVRGDARAEVPFWTEAGEIRAQWWVGGAVSAETFVDAEHGGTPWLGPGDLLRVSDPPPRFHAGPTGRVEVVAGSLVATAETLVGWTPSAFWPVGTVSVRSGAVGLDVHADPRMQSGNVRVGKRPVVVEVGSARLDADQVSTVDQPFAGEDLWLAWSDLSVSPGRARFGGGAAWDVLGGALNGATARIGYDDGCASAGVHASFAPDRAIPDVGLTATLRR